MTKPIVAFRKFANAPKNCRLSSDTKIIFMALTVVFYTVMIIKYDVSETA